eukprot:490782_1
MTQSGLIKGTINNKIRMFQSIPYANPPINNLRWADPEPITPWGNNTIDANIDPPGCIQIRATQMPHINPKYTSEACLFLNIFTPLTTLPDGSPNDNIPVMVFIHGGNFKLGYSGGMLYNGSIFANATNTIIAAINYRLGPLGFLWSIEAGMEGNFGFRDQQIALKWIKENIQFFGGNSDKITIFGQSAGAMSVALHLMQTSTDDADLYNYAIMESEPFGLPMRDTKTWGYLPHQFMNYTGCDPNIFDNNTPGELWTCLRNRTVSQILFAQKLIEGEILVDFDHFLQIFMPWTPTMGTNLFIEQPLFAFQKGKLRDIPWMIGTTKNEGKSFIYGAFPEPISFEMVFATLVVMVGREDAEQIVVHYPPPVNVTDYRDYFSLIATDGIFACPTRNATASHEMINEFKDLVYLYHFNHASSFNEQMWEANMTECWNKSVCHGEELIFVFHPNTGPIDANYTEEETELAITMETYWTQFAKYGNPQSAINNNVNTEWVPFTLGSEPSIQFQTNDVVVQSNFDRTQNQCDFWDSLGYNWLLK